MSIQLDQKLLLVAASGFIFNGTFDMVRSIVVYSNVTNPAFQEMKMFVFCKAVVFFCLGLAMLFHQRRSFVYDLIWILPYCWGYELISWSNYDYRVGFIELFIVLSLLVVLNIETINTLIHNHKLYIAGRVLWIIAVVIHLSVSAFIVFNPRRSGYTLAANLLNTAWILAILITLVETFRYLRIFSKMIPFLAFLSSLLMLVYPFSRISSFYDDGLMVVVLLYLPPVSLALSLFCYFVWMHYFSGSKHRVSNSLSVSIAIVAILKGVFFYWLSGICS